MNILLFGGSFNPPHLGHQIVTQQAFELIPEIDELWLLPNFNHTFNKELAPATLRLKLCRLLITHMAETEAGSVKRVKLCPIEIDKQLSGSTYETLQLLKEDHPEYRFSFLIGSDQLPVFNKWQRWQDLLNQMTFYVYPRAGYPLTPLYPGMKPVTSPNQVITNISSTLIRKRLTQNLSLTHLLPPPILKLYQQIPLRERHQM
jgi:nicotinate-nucleotide adenylyltransferase